MTDSIPDRTGNTAAARDRAGAAAGAGRPAERRDVSRVSREMSHTHRMRGPDRTLFALALPASGTGPPAAHAGVRAARGRAPRPRGRAPRARTWQVTWGTARRRSRGGAACLPPAPRQRRLSGPDVFRRLSLSGHPIYMCRELSSVRVLSSLSDTRRVSISRHWSLARRNPPRYYWYVCRTRDGPP
jgi:hypothetical protein